MTHPLSALRRPLAAMSRDPRLRDRSGMTLLEVLVVMVIIGLLATLGSLQLMGYLGRAKADTAKLQIQELGTALDLFRMDVGRVPTTEEGLGALMRQPEGAERWGGPYLRKKATLADPWGRPYRYVAPAESREREYDLVSFGADGRAGGEGENRDVSSSDDR